ncbi:MAG: hypothetical protein ACEPOW_12170 [Bacteroidales bacterium]
MKLAFRKSFSLLILLFIINNSLFSQISKHLKLGGALRFNYRYKNWDTYSKNVGGDFVLDIFRLNAKANYSNLFLDAEYRFYPSDFGGGMLHHGFIGYNFNENINIQIGVNQVPFGLLPYTGHSWFANLPYYIGLGDDHDAGIKLEYKKSNWNLALAWYKNAEGGKKWIKYSNGKSGYGVDPARYSYDLAGDVEETNQGNARVEYELNNQKFGVSGQLGNYFNHVTKKNNSHYALAVHYQGSFLKEKRLDIRLEALKYNYIGTKENTITIVAFNYPYNIANEAYVFLGGIAYTIPINWKFIKSIQIYENYSYMHKPVNGFNDTQMNVVGMLVEAGPVYTYIDYASAKNQDWFGPWGAFGKNANSYGLGRGAENPEWNSWLNINIGYYF